MLRGAKHVTIARKATSWLVAPLLGLNVSRSLLLLLLLLLLPDFLYHVLANLLSPPQNLYLRAHGCAADPCDHKPACAECSGNDGAEAVQGYHIYNQVSDMSIQEMVSY